MFRGGSSLRPQSETGSASSRGLIAERGLQWNDSAKQSSPLGGMTLSPALRQAQPGQASCKDGSGCSTSGRGRALIEAATRWGVNNGALKLRVSDSGSAPSPRFSANGGASATVAPADRNSTPALGSHRASPFIPAALTLPDKGSEGGRIRPGMPEDSGMVRPQQSRPAWSGGGSAGGGSLKGVRRVKLNLPDAREGREEEGQQQQQQVAAQSTRRKSLLAAVRLPSLTIDEFFEGGM